MKPWLAITCFDDPAKLSKLAHGAVTQRGPFFGLVVATAQAQALRDFTLLGDYASASEAHARVASWASGQPAA